MSEATAPRLKENRGLTFLNLPAALFGTSLFHSGWSGQTVLFDLKRRRYAVVLTTRCGGYSRAKRDRFKAIAALLCGGG